MTADRDPVGAWNLPEAGEVQLWRIDMDARLDEEEESLALLDEDERCRAARFHFPLDRRRFIQRRAALRGILSGYTGQGSQEIRYTIGSHGKPALRSGAGAPAFTFNLSDSSALALVAIVREGRIGVDVEAVDRSVEFLTLARRFFAPGEFEVLRGLDPSRHRDAFFRAWTRKEALLKGVGSGLLLPLDSFEVTLAPGAPARVLRWDVPGEPRDVWMLRHLEPAPGYVGALATDSAVDSVTVRNWD